MSEFMLKNGMKLYYEDIGSGKPAVFLHGWSGSHELYNVPVRSLKDNARCVIYDHRGHHGSKTANREPVTIETLASDLNELIMGLSLSEVTLVGWSMGAGVAMSYIRKYGCSALRYIVLCDMTPRLLNDDEWTLGMQGGKFRKENMDWDSGKDFLTLYKEFAVSASPTLAELTEAELHHRIEQKMQNYDVNILKQLAISMKSEDNRDVVGKITVPLSYFYAVPGSIFSPGLAEWYSEQAAVPFSAVRFPDSSHKFISEHPDMFTAEIGKLL